jgi:hypothetical protein
VYGPLTEEQVLELSPDHEGGGAILLCSPKVLKEELGLPSGFVPFKPFFWGKIRSLRLQHLRCHCERQL